MKPPVIPTPAAAVRLVFKRACTTIAKNAQLDVLVYEFLAKQFDAPEEAQRVKVRKAARKE